MTNAFAFLPVSPMEQQADLELYGLTAVKALLSVGAIIPDGSAEEMEEACKGLFPQVYDSRKSDLTQYEAWNAVAYLDVDHQLQWGY
jgi:hypothetical protein